MTRTSTVTLTEVARAVGMKKHRLVGHLQRTGLWNSFVRLGQGPGVRFDQRVIDVLHAQLGQPHRSLEPVEADWLSQWLTRGGDAHAP